MNDVRKQKAASNGVGSGELVLPPKIGFFRHLARGCGTLPHCGEHPGTVFLFGFVLMGAAAGAKGGWIGALGGAGIMLATFGSIYLCGAYDRSRTDERIDKQNTTLSHAGTSARKQDGAATGVGSSNS